MSRKSSLVLVFLPIAACSRPAVPTPLIVQTTPTSDTLHLTHGFATQIELPPGQRADSVVVGSDTLVRATAEGSVVNLAALGNLGETNIIVRASGEDGKPHVLNYRLVVFGP